MVERIHRYTVPVLVRPEDQIVCAIDPGLRNCAIRICQGNKTLFQEKYDFLEEGKETWVSSIDQILKTISPLGPWFEKCDWILIETQMNVNKKVTLVMNVLITLLLMLKTKNVIQVKSTLKSCPKVLPGGDKVSRGKMTVKTWAIKEAKLILEKTGDTDLLTRISKMKKKDDHSDVVCYTHVWQKLLSNPMLARDVLNDSVSKKLKLDEVFQTDECGEWVVVCSSPTRGERRERSAPSCSADIREEVHVREVSETHSGVHHEVRPSE